MWSSSAADRSSTRSSAPVASTGTGCASSRPRPAPAASFPNGCRLDLVSTERMGPATLAILRPSVEPTSGRGPLATHLPDIEALTWLVCDDEVMPPSASLPAWLVAELPPVKPHGRVDASGPSAVVYVAPDGLTTTFDNVKSAYEALFEIDLEFGETLLEREDALVGMLMFPSEREGFVTSWMAHSNTACLETLEEDYRESLACAEAYRGDGGSDFLTAYRYVDTHPAFWVRWGGDGGRAPWFWETGGHMNRVDLSVSPDEDGVAVVYLETGMHTPDMAEHYEDPYLGAAGRTFEDAVIMLARHVAVMFNDDGTETGDKPPNPQADELLATLDERTKLLDAPGSTSSR